MLQCLERFPLGYKTQHLNLSSAEGVNTNVRQANFRIAIYWLTKLGMVKEFMRIIKSTKNLDFKIILSAILVTE